MRKVMVLIIVSLLTGCGSDNDNWVGDPQTCSFYSLQNNSNYDLDVLVESYGFAQGSMVGIGETKEIAILCALGDPRPVSEQPSMNITSFTITAFFGDVETVVYSGIRDEDWVVDSSSSRTTLPYILVIDESDFIV